MKRKRKTHKSPPKRKADLHRSLEQLLQQIVPDYVQRLASAEAKAERLGKELITLKVRLAGLLSKDQIEAAKVCGCAPEIYAIECIDIWKEKIFPSFPEEIRPLSDLRQNSDYLKSL